VAHLEDGHADAGHADQVTLGLLEDGQRKHGRAGAKLKTRGVAMMTSSSIRDAGRSG